jgi:hypothetical protein
VIIFSVISLLREDPLSPSILDMFFLKISDHSSVCKTELIYLKFSHFLNSLNSNDPNRGRQFDSILSIEFGPILLQYLSLLSNRVDGVALKQTAYFLLYRDKCALFHYFLSF